MNRPRVIRLLRIGWSAGCVVARLLLTGMWFRSYWYRDQLYKIAATERYGCVSDDGSIELWQIDTTSGAITGTGWRRGVSYEDNPNVQQFYWSLLFRGFVIGPNVFIFPFWLPVFAGLITAAAPWIPWSTRFSLRTLLIATTLAAIVLGPIVWTMRT